MLGVPELHCPFSNKKLSWLWPIQTVYCQGAVRANEARILQPGPLPPQLLLYKRNFYSHWPPVQSVPTPPPPHPTVHSCLALSSLWFTAGPDLQPADLGADLSPELTLVLGTSSLYQACPLLMALSSAPPPLVCLSGAPVGVGCAVSPSSPLLPLLWPVSGHHFPLLLQSLGVKCRHLESIRRSLLSIALSCPSTMSSDSVRIYWPWMGDGGQRGSAHVGPALCSPTRTCLPLPASLPCSS